MVPRENKNNAYAKFRGTNKKNIMVFSEVANRSRMVHVIGPSTGQQQTQLSSGND